MPRGRRRSRRNGNSLVYKACPYIAFLYCKKMAIVDFQLDDGGMYGAVFYPSFLR